MTNNFRKHNLTAAQKLEGRWRLDPETDCHVWLHWINHDGYGRVRFGGRMVYAHVLAYESVYGAVPEGLRLDHTCRNRACVNPDHLEPVTVLENTRRGANVRLTHEQIQAIRTDTRFQKVIAAEYGISQQHVSAIKTGRYWSDV